MTSIVSVILTSPFRRHTPTIWVVCSECERTQIPCKYYSTVALLDIKPTQPPNASANPSIPSCDIHSPSCCSLDQEVLLLLILRNIEPTIREAGRLILRPCLRLVGSGLAWCYPASCLVSFFLSTHWQSIPPPISYSPPRFIQRISFYACTLL